MSFKGKLIKLSSNSNSLRSNEIFGEVANLPKVGERFQLTAEALEENIRAAGGIRIVTTSIVSELVELESVFVFKTENSSYRFELLQ